jgi:hypothetical protein
MREKCYYDLCEENMTRQVKILIGAIFIACVLIGYELIEVKKNINRNEQHSREATTPLPTETVVELCRKFELTDNVLCDFEHEIYAPDFYKVIEMALSRGMSFDDVSELLGEYQIGDCYLKLSNEIHQKICDYDLRGDKIFYFTIIFDESEDVIDSFFPTVSWRFSEP